MCVCVCVFVYKERDEQQKERDLRCVLETYVAAICCWLVAVVAACVPVAV